MYLYILSVILVIFCCTLYILYIMAMPVIVTLTVMDYSKILKLGGDKIDSESTVQQ